MNWAPILLPSFEAKNILCTVDKPQIAQAIWEYAVDTSCKAVMNCIHETDAWWWHFAASLTLEKGDSYNAIAESYVDSEKGITDKRQWGSMGYEDGDFNKEITHRKRESYCEFQQRNRMLM